MLSKEKKLLLEAYGLSRMVLGVGEIVGLSAGYFLIEFILQYPSNVVVYVLDEEILAFMYLAVLLRGLFHVVAGIGIARLRMWVRGWLLCGWPIMVIITIGLAHSAFENWHNQGYVTGFLQVFSWPKIFVYLAVAAFDVMFVSQSIQLFNENISAYAADESMEAKKIATFFFIAVFVFCLLLFLGRPIQKGFHKGFYKNSGKVSASGPGRPTRVLEPKESTGSEQAKVQAPNEGEEGLPADAIIRKSKVTQAVVDESTIEEKEELQKKVESTQEKEAEGGTPYRKMMGFVGGLCLAAGILFQLFEMQRTRQTQAVSLACYVFMGFGFFLWIIYGLSSKITPVYLTGFISVILCICIILMKLKNDSL